MPARDVTASCETIAALAERTGVRFGTSGVRGLVADLTPEICRAYTHAFLDVLDGTGGDVLIGHDLRPSSPAIVKACAEAVASRGYRPVNAGVLPTPALAFAAQCRGVPAIMVTGSHIPFDRNGIKFYRPEGEITKDDEARMIAQAARIGESAPAQPLAPPDPGPLSLYAARYTGLFETSVLSGMKVGVYEHSSAARDVLHVILRALGAETVSLGRSDSFVPIDTEAVRPEDRALARAWTAEHGLDALVTTDGDADRPLISDETGEWLRGDVLGILCARALGAASVVTPVSSNTALEACGAFAETLRTRIGSPYVIAAMETAQRRPVVGYEANGGFLLGDDVQLAGRPLAALKTRDALLPILLVLAAARGKGGKISHLVASLPARYTFSDRLQNVNVEACRALLASLAREPEGFASLGGGAVAALDTTDGVRATSADGGILHLRLSGNAPELRCYAEADTAERASRACAACLAAVAKRI